MCVTICGRFCPDEGIVAGYGNRIREKYTAKWGVQIVEMIFQTCSRIGLEISGNNIHAGRIDKEQEWSDLKKLLHSYFSFLLQISSEPFSVKDYQLIQYLIPVPVSLRPLFDYVLTGKIQHLFQCRIAWEYAFCFRDFPILTV